MSAGRDDWTDDTPRGRCLHARSTIIARTEAHRWRYNAWQNAKNAERREAFARDEIKYAVYGAAPEDDCSDEDAMRPDRVMFVGRRIEYIAGERDPSDDADARALLRWAHRKFKPRYFKAVLLFIQGFTLAEIGPMIGRRDGASRLSVERTRQILREMLFRIEDRATVQAHIGPHSWDKEGEQVRTVPKVLAGPGCLPTTAPAVAAPARPHRPVDCPYPGRPQCTDCPAPNCPACVVPGTSRPVDAVETEPQPAG